MIGNRFDFIFFSFNEVRWWEFEVRSVYVVLMVGGQEVRMEHGVNLPLVGKFQLVHLWTEDLDDLEWALSLHGEFLVIGDEAEILGF